MQPEDDLDAPTQVGAFEVPQESPDDLQKPALRGFEIVREIGRGGMGLVYLARDTELDRYVAIKTFHVACDARLTSVLAEEAKAAGKLDHPAIVPIYQIDAGSSPPFFSMAFVEGSDLAHRITQQVMDARDAAKLGVKIADALAHAHEANVLHLDIKPANILFDRRGEPRVTDFGLFALCSLKGVQGVAGTPQFMSPEQASGRINQVDGTADVYSLGAVLFAAVAGRPPIVSSSEQDLIFKVVSQRPQSLRSFGLRVPPAFDAIVLKCLEKDPTKRYQSMSELKEDLERFLAGKPVQARLPGVIENVTHFVQEHVLAASVSGTAVLLLLLSVAGLLFSLLSEKSALEADLKSAENIIHNQSHLFHTTLNHYAQEHSDEKIALKVAMSVETETAADLYRHGNLEMAAKCAAKAVLAAEQLEEPFAADLHNILAEYFAGVRKTRASKSGSQAVIALPPESASTLDLARHFMQNADSSIPEIISSKNASRDE